MRYFFFFVVSDAKGKIHCNKNKNYKPLSAKAQARRESPHNKGAGSQGAEVARLQTNYSLRKQIVRDPSSAKSA